MTAKIKSAKILKIMQPRKFSTANISAHMVSVPIFFSRSLVWIFKKLICAGYIAEKKMYCEIRISIQYTS